MYLYLSKDFNYAYITSTDTFSKNKFEPQKLWKLAIGEKFAETYEEMRLKLLKWHQSQSKFYEAKFKWIKLKQKLKATNKI